MHRKISAIHVLSIFSAVLVCVTTVCGLMAWDTALGFDAVNQYGDTIRMWGSGVYARDSYFRVPIFIGSDLTVLLTAVPMLIGFTVMDVIRRDRTSRLLLTSLLAWVMYYGASLCFGVSYNALFLVYTALFGCSLFAFITGMGSVSPEEYPVPDRLCGPSVTVFLVLSGISTLVAWFPDIIASFGNDGKLSLIEVYTTEITYVLDMGIISPTAFLCLYLLKKRRPMGVVLLSVLTLGITVVGVMMIAQTGFQIAAGVDVPVPALITKSLIFVLLAVYAITIIFKLYRSIKEKAE